MNVPNHLANEKSPYLQQHAYNPVDWYPWGEEAFTKAKNQNKPVFLSIGYSTCHWCHVMEKESFEDNKIAGLMNDVFVSIKVDREERPDIDNVYMTVCQMLTGRGGWPLTIIMTPDKKPFFAGTYLPKDNRMGNLGMKGLISKVKELWNTQSEEILKSADDISHSLLMNTTPRISKEIDASIFEKAFDELSKNFDKEHGGFGTAPKFPTAHNLLFLLRYWKRSSDRSALDMVKKTLYAIRNGGIFDQIGFGLHRYSTDREWFVPHFEKMLYDQAQLITVYTEAFQATKNNFYKAAAEEIITYVLRDMTSAEGGFYSAEDADSENKEGKFYTWTEQELKSALGPDAELINKIFGIEENGNWIDHFSNGSDKTNILFMAKDIEDLTGELNLSTDNIKKLINSSREKLFSYRKNRVHPFKDKKILTDWNSLIISALAKAAVVFENDSYIIAAEKAMNFILGKMKSKDGKILHRHHEGESLFNAGIDDYAYLAAALLDLYEATFKYEYLYYAVTLTKEMIDHFWDDKEGGFFFTPDYAEKLIIRSKEIYDGALPSGNSVAMLNLIRLARITGNTAYENKVFKIINVFSRNIFSTPSIYTQALCALDFIYGPSHEIVICGEKENNDTMDIIRTLHKYYIPGKVVVLNSSGDDKISAISPFIKNQAQIQKKTTVYICSNFSCKEPVTDRQELERVLKAM